MKLINNYIQEKLIINKNLKVGNNQITFDNLLLKYPNLRIDTSHKFLKILEGDKKIFDLYSSFFKPIIKNNFQQEIKKIESLVSVKCTVAITTLDNFNKDQWYDIIVSDNSFYFFELLFNQNESIIKIYLGKDKINNNFINDIGKIIDFILSYKK